MKIISLCITLLASCAICLIIIPLIIRSSAKFGFLDKPNERKIHVKPLSRFGGVAIFISSVIGIVSGGMVWHVLTSFPVFFSAVGILFLIGLWDDFKNISARLRFMLQICCALALVSSGVRLTSLYGIFGIYELNFVAGYIISVLIIVGVTNAFNLIDGIDGLAAGMGLIGMLILGWISYILREYSLLIVFAGFTGSLLAFLKYNWSPAKIFMGDSGSLVLGFLLSVSGIYLTEKAHGVNSPIKPEQVAIFVTALLIIPVFDTVRVFASRIRRGFSPFKGDRTHIHHLFLVAGLNHRKTTGILCAFEIVLLILALALPHATSISIVLLIMLFLFHCVTLSVRINQSMEEWLKIVQKMETDSMIQ